MIEQKDIEFFLTKSMDVIEPLIIEIKKICKKQSVKYSCDCLNKYILACRRLNVSYLNFSRSISTIVWWGTSKTAYGTVIAWKTKKFIDCVR